MEKTKRNVNEQKIEEEKPEKKNLKLIFQIKIKIFRYKNI